MFLVSSAFGSQVRINEVASEESGLRSDWVEIFVVSGTVNLSGWELFEKSQSVKTFPPADFTYSGGTYIVVHFNRNDSDETFASGDVNASGTVDLYTSDTGLTGTSNVVSIRNREGLIVDGVVYSDHSSWTGSQQESFNQLVSTGQWTGTLDGGASVNFTESVDAAGGVGIGNSIGRNHLSHDSDNRNDWTHFKFRQTQGRINPQVIPCPPMSGNAHGLATEVAPSQSPAQGGDFLEVFFFANTDLCGVRIYEGGKLIKTFPQVTPRSGPFGPYLVFHAGIKVSRSHPDETDWTGDLNNDGVIDLYSDESTAGLTGSTHNTITIKNSDGTFVDFVSFAEQDAFFSQTHQEAYDVSVSTGSWVPPCLTGDRDCYVAGSVFWSSVSGRSLSRKIGPEGFPQNSSPSGAANWQVGPVTPGWGYGESIFPRGAILEIFHSPFSPYGDGKFREAVITGTVPKDSTVTIRIYDIHGRQIRSLLEGVLVRASQTEWVRWDGRKNNGQIAALGIYIIRMQARSSDGNHVEASGTVVLGRKL